VNAPRSWPNSSLSSSPEGIAAQFTFTRFRERRGTQFVGLACRDEFPSQYLFSPRNQDRHIRWRHRFQLGESQSQTGTASDDLVEKFIS